MWVPRTEQEIQASIDSKTLTETRTFDAKLALPAAGKNKDLAKDLCAMTVDGGTLLYGVGGSDPTRPDMRSPFELAGAAERIDQVAQTCISEPPLIEIHEIRSDEQPGKGYLCVAVPASPRAPHMLIVDRDNRYWGRGATGNRILSEGEVARLYARREQWEIDRTRLLAEILAQMPFAYEVATVGTVAVFARPVVPGRELLRGAANGQDISDFLTRELVPHAQASDPYPGQGTSGLGDAYSSSRAGAELWIMSREKDSSSPYQARLEIAPDGSATYWHSPILNTGSRSNGRYVVMERSVTRAVRQFLATVGWLYERASFTGRVDIGVGVLGIEDAVGAALAGAFEPGPVYGAPDYLRHERVTSNELRSDVDAITRRLLAPLYEVISPRGYDPLAERER
jgi:hypothetical protein